MANKLVRPDTVDQVAEKPLRKTSVRVEPVNRGEGRRYTMAQLDRRPNRKSLSGTTDRNLGLHRKHPQPVIKRV